MGHDRLCLRLALLLQEKGPRRRQTPTAPVPFPDLLSVAAAVEVSEGLPRLRRQRRGGARPMALPPAAEGPEVVCLRREQPARADKERAEDAAAEGLLVAGCAGAKLLHGGLSEAVLREERGRGEGKRHWT